VCVSTLVVDAVRGGPAAAVGVVLSARGDESWRELVRSQTSADGRIPDLAGELPAGVYRLVFDVEGYLGADAFYPEVVIVFRITQPGEHHHVPLLLSPFAYTTYRGS
jgi:5-hydroxyisourate hydrolase